MKIAELIAELGKLPADSLVCLDCLTCGRTVTSDLEIETPEYMPGTVWLVDAS